VPAPWFLQNWIPIPQRCFLPNLVEISSVVLENSFKWKVYAGRAVINTAHLSLRLRWAKNLEKKKKVLLLLHFWWIIVEKNVDLMVRKQTKNKSSLQLVFVGIIVGKNVLWKHVSMLVSQCLSILVLLKINYWNNFFIKSFLFSNFSFNKDICFCCVLCLLNISTKGE